MRRYWNFAVFVALAAVWGSAFMVTKVGLSYLPPTLFAALRFDIAAVTLFAYAALTTDRLRPRTARDWIPLVMGGALSIGAHNGVLFAGQQYVKSAVAAVLLGLIPVITPALTRLTASGKRLSREGVLGVLIGFVGVVVIANPDPANLLASDLRGVVLVLVSAVIFAVGAVLTHDNETSLPLASSQAWMMLIGSVVLHVGVALHPGESLTAGVWTREAVGALVYLALVAGVGGFGMYFYLLERVGPIEVSLIEYATPIFAAVSGWFVLGETIETTTVVGFVVIFTGFTLLKRGVLRTELGRLRQTVRD